MEACVVPEVGGKPPNRCPAESSCAGPARPSGTNTPSISRFYQAAEAYRPCRWRIMAMNDGFCMPVVGSMPDSRRVPVPSPPHTISSRSSSSGGLFSLRTNSGGFPTASGRTSRRLPPADSLHSGRLVLAEQRRALLTAAAGQLDPHGASEDMRGGGSLPGHFHAELRAQVGDNGGRSADNEFGDLGFGIWDFRLPLADR